MTEPLVGDTEHAIVFLQNRLSPATLTAIHIDAAGKKGKIETATFNVYDDAERAKCRKWIDARQNRANMYFAVNRLLRPMDKKATREDLKSFDSLHVDLDPRQGEDQDAALERITNQVATLEPRPSWVISSGGGVQLIWDLVIPVTIDGEVAIAEDLKLYNLQLERDLGGDACHNLDRILRLPGTINLPDERKLKKGRRPALASVIVQGECHWPLKAFKQAPAPAQQAAPATSTAGALRSAPFIVNLDDDEHTKNLKPWVKDVITKGKSEDSTRVWSSRSHMVYAIVNECVRSGVPEEKIAALLTDPNNPFNAQVREKGRAMQREVDRLISRAKAYAADPELEQMNEQFFVVAMGGKARVGEKRFNCKDGSSDIVFSTFDDFRALQNKYRITFMTKDKDGNPVEKQIPRGDWWLGHPQRRQYDRGLVYRPDVDEDEVDGAYNLWTGFSVTATPGSKHESFLEHVRTNICSGNEGHYQYLVRWMAHVIQHRDKPSGVAVILRSDEEGSGKTFFSEHFGKLWGSHFKLISQGEQITGKFNKHLQSCSLVSCEEALFAGDPRHSGPLKAIVTQGKMMVEPKGIDPYEADSYINLLLTSNKSHVVSADRTARRYFVLDVGTGHLNDFDYFEAIKADLLGGGHANLLHFLQTLPLEGFKVGDVPKTAALQNQKAETRSGVDALIQYICDEAQLPFAHERQWDVAITTPEQNGRDFWKWALDKFPDLRRRTPTVIGNELRKVWGVKSYESHGRCGRRFPPLEDLRAAFIKRCGPTEWSRAATEWLQPPLDGFPGFDANYVAPRSRRQPIEDEASREMDEATEAAAQGRLQ